MKKLIAISVVFVLLATAAFAEITVKGQVIGNVTTVSGNTESDDDVGASASLNRVRIEAEGTNDDETFGAWVRAEAGGLNVDQKALAKAQGPSDYIDAITVTGFYGNVWWQPIDAFKLLIGGNGGDGFFGADGVTRYGFYGEVGADVGIVNEGWAFSSAFFGGFNADSGAAAILTLKPIGEALEVNIGVPFSDGFAKDQYNKTTIQVAYNADFGKIALTYQSNSGNSPKFVFSDPADPTGNTPLPRDKWEIEGDGGKIWAYGGLKLGENLDLDIGVGYTLPVEEKDAYTYNAPIGAGLGVNFTSGQLGLKARVLGEFMGSVKPKTGDAYDLPLVVYFDILPSFAVNDNLTAFLDAGIKFTAEDKNGDTKLADSLFGWHANPYIAYTVGSGAFYAGINVSSTGAEKAGIDWAVPIGLSVSF